MILVRWVHRTASLWVTILKEKMAEADGFEVLLVAGWGYKSVCVCVFQQDIAGTDLGELNLIIFR